LNEEQRVAVVSGASRGIGREVARQLAALGLSVVVGARDEAKAREVAAEIGSGAVGHRLDVTDQWSVDELAGFVEAEVGRCDALVNNAGVLLDAGRPAVEADIDLIRETFETNTLGAWRLSLALLPMMRRGGYGRIANVSSGMGQLNGMNGTSPGYRTSKTALNVMTRVLSEELRAGGIKVNSACPGFVRTDMGGPHAPRSVEEGADTPVWLATLADDGPTGGFFRNREPIPW
jgi:NAD(P)-dependent dehydrogenase (short-subunit alcohol dehydrogenase family)